MSSVSRQLLWRISLLALVVAFTSTSQAMPPDVSGDADSVMMRAKTQANAEHKKILLTFGASWCGNCRLFDKFLADPAIHPIMEKVFVFADLDTGEMPNDKRHANIPGGIKLQNSLGGEDAGFPFIVMLDADGSLIANSIQPSNGRHGGNTGYPDAPNEIDWFIQMLKKASPSLSSEELQSVQEWLTAHNSAHRKAAR